MITGIDAITYSTDKWDEARLFLNDWGLKELAFLTPRSALRR
jgi:hypothetical protein